MILSQEQLNAKYGKPNKTGKGYLVTIELPFPMIVAWQRSQVVNSIQCHKLIADRLKNALTELLEVYGLKEIQRLGINIYGGCFNYRLMRGGTKLSTHAYGVAIDLDPDRNLLHESAKTARFARPEYKKMHEIFYKHGFINLGLEKGYDFMHYQIAI